MEWGLVASCFLCVVREFVVVLVNHAEVMMVADRTTDQPTDQLTLVVVLLCCLFERI